MSERICVLCESQITDGNDSRKHLIPNAIGGRRKVRGFLCNICNKIIDVVYINNFVGKIWVWVKRNNFFLTYCYSMGYLQRLEFLVSMKLKQ